MDIKLSAIEITLLLSRITNDHRAFELGDVIAKPLLLKLFSSFEELVQPNEVQTQLVTIGVTEDEMWLCRNIISPFDNIEGKPIGIPLLLKIQHVILAFNTDVEIEEEGTEATYAERKKDAEKAKEEFEQKRLERNKKRREAYRKRKES